MKTILRLIKSYFVLVALITFIKIVYNYWALWNKVNRIKELSVIEMHIVISLNAAIYGFGLAALVMIFLTIHASLASFKVQRKNINKIDKYN
ncbi:MAG: hypothetical protein ABJG88_01265 [Litorimonas sp.]